MKYLKYQSEYQFLSELSDELKKSLSDEFIIQSDKRIGAKKLDLFIENPTTGSTYTIEVKGNPSDTSLPPEIIPHLQSLKDKIELKDNHFVVLSLPDVDESVKYLYEQNDLDVFEYKKHKDNLTQDFISFLKKLDKEE